MSEALGMFMSLLDLVEDTILSRAYTVALILMLVINVFLKYVFTIKRVYHLTKKTDGKNIIDKARFETRTQGLMFCGLFKSKYLGVNFGKKADYIITFEADSIKNLKPINLDVFSFFLPWSVIKSLTGQWVTTKIGDVRLSISKEFEGGAYVDKIDIEKHKGKLRFFSWARNVSLSFINIPLLMIIYMPCKVILFAGDHMLLTGGYITFLIVWLTIFYKLQNKLNDFMRK